MKNFEIDFVLNSTDRIIVMSPELLEDTNMFTDVSIFLRKAGKSQLLISDYCFHESMYVLRALLVKALNNELLLHPSITDDIGLLFNQDLLDIPGLVYTKWEGLDYWVGNSYLAWYAELATWIYNGRDGEIVLHVTPIYPGYFFDCDISYEQWVASYKPLFTITIPRDIAQRWAHQAGEIVDTIDWNSTHWKTRKEKRA